MNQQQTIPANIFKSTWLWSIVGLMGTIAIVDSITSSTRIVGYLYVAPILMACFRLGSKVTNVLTGISAIAIALLFWTHLSSESMTEITITNRLLAIVGVILAGYLGNRAIYCQQKIDYLDAEVRNQQQLLYLREDFCMTLTHDLKTPLLGAISTIEAFDRSQFGSVTAIQKQALATMKRSHQSSLQLLDTLLEIYRHDSDGIVLDRSPLNLVPLIQETISKLQDLANSREISIDLKNQESNTTQSFWVNGDAIQLERVLTNLISNSIKFSPRQEKIEIELSQHANHLTLQVMDKSYGIPPEVLPYLFDRFYPGHLTRDRRSTGLGLYLSRQIIDAHGGTIQAENRAPRGTILTICLESIAMPEDRNDHQNTDQNSVS
jgi:two-component system, NarL family, sensor kinase